MSSSHARGVVRLLAAVGLTACCAVVGCRGAKPAAEPPPPSPVTVAQPVMYAVQSYYEYNGYLDAVETVEIRARVKGFLTDVKFVEGEEVAAKQPLYTIDDREYVAGVAKARADILKADADILNAKAQVDLARAEEVRQRDSFNKGGGAKSDLDKAVATLASNEAAVKTAEANKASALAAKETADLQLEYTDIRSPIAGRISRTLVTRGNLVGQNESTLLTTIVSVDPLYVYFDAPERDFVDYQRGLTGAAPSARPAAALPVAVGIATETGYPHEGAIDFRENRVDTGTGTVRIRGRVPNPLVPPGHARVLYPGLYARVRVPNGQKTDRLVIPEEALMTGQEGKFVYVVAGDKNLVEKRVVAVGANVWRAAESGADEWALKSANPPAGPPGPGGPPPTTLAVRSIVAIDKGLAAGDRVIVIGLQKARPGAPVAPEQWVLKSPAAK